MHSNESVFPSSSSQDAPQRVPHASLNASKSTPTTSLTPIDHQIRQLESLKPNQNRNALFETVFSRLAPYIGHSEAQVVLAQVMITLKLEGIVGKDLTARDVAKLNLIRDAVLQNPQKRDAAITMAKKFLK